MRFDPAELQVPGFASFPGDGSTDVCASGAITWTLDDDSGPRIDSSKCFGCGICATRCPVGAIHMTKDTKAVLVDEDTKHIRADRAANALTTRAKIAGVPRHGAVALEGDSRVEHVAERISGLLGRSSPRFPNLLARNLLLGTGWQAAMRRSGDTNVRIDIFAQRSTQHCAIEVEFSDAVIDAPRCVLDSLSVLLSRYSLKRDSLTGMVFAFSLPNQRSEYWQVIADIEKVLSVRVHTVTPMALMMLLWAGKSLTAMPYGTYGSASIRSGIEKSIGRKLAVSPGVAAALETAK